jgi:KipI family sensor histidine kinase inhibitor
VSIPSVAASPVIVPLGDSALTITLGDRVEPSVAARVRALAADIRGATLSPVRDIALGYAAVTVWYDALHTDYAAMVVALEPILAAATTRPMSAATRASIGRDHVISVRYDGPDLEEVARRTGLSPSEIVARHSGRSYTVYFLGFVPGFAYLGDLDPALVLPRRTEPRPRVPAGAVAIAGAQTAVYPYAIPGGWHLIGRTAAELFDPMQDPPATLAPGDHVRFVAAAD